MSSLSDFGRSSRRSPLRSILSALNGHRALDAGRWVSRPCLGVLEMALAVAIGSGIFLSILALPVTWPAIGELELWLAGSAVIATGLGILVAVIGRSLPSTITRILSIAAAAACLAVLALPLAAHWSAGTTNGGVIGALIPYSDAAGYMAGTWHLLAEGELNHWNMRRPINATFHAVRWVLAGGDMTVSFALMAWLIGLAGLLAAAFVRRDLGWAAAAVFVVAWLPFVEEWLPLTLSEAHGCFLGMIGFALTWQAARDKSALTFALGMAVVSMALAARAGPFFLLPTLLVWGVLYLGTTFRTRVLQAVAGVIGLGLGQSVSRLFNGVWGDGVNSLYSNFSYTLYGMTAGGKQWNAVYEERPDIFQAGLGESSALAANIYQASLDNFLADPGLLFGFLLKELARFPDFLKGWPMLPDQHGDFWFGLLIVGGLGLLLTVRKPLSGLLLAGLAGLWLSSPFLMLDGGHRVFAPGVPWLFGSLAFGVFTAVGIALFLVRAVKEVIRPGEGNDTLDDEASRAGSGLARHGAVMVGAITVAFVLLGPPIALALYPKIEAEPTGLCEADEIERIIRPGWASIRLQAVPADTPGVVRTPDVRHPDYFEDMPLQVVPFMKAVSELKAPYALMQVYDLISTDAGRQTSVHTVRRADVPPLPTDGTVSLCGKDLCPNCYLYDIRSWRRVPDTGRGSG